MSDRSRWVRARWQATEQTTYRAEVARFGPIPDRNSDRHAARDRSLWQTEAYATIYLEADRARRRAARQARRHGATWSQIGAALGISRQAASKLLDRPAASPAGDGWMIDHKAS